MQHLTQFETADEHFWISEGWINGNLEIVPARIPTYWQAMQNKDWAHTNINDKPGVSLAIISGLGQYIYHGWPDRLVRQMNFSQIFDPQKTEDVYCAFRLPLIIFNGLLGLFFLLAIKRLTENNWAALIGASLIILNPVLMGISQVVNPDALLWVFVLAAILSYMLFVKKDKWYDALLAALFLGFAFLTKYTSTILIPFFLAVLLIYLWLEYQEISENKKLRRKILIHTLFYPLIIALAVGIFSLGLPAVFLKKSILFKGIDQISNFEEVVKILIWVNALLFLDALIIKSWIANLILRCTQPLKKFVVRFVYLALALTVLVVFVNWAFGHNFLHVPNIQYDDQDVENLFAAASLPDKLMLELYPFVFSSVPIVLAGLLFGWLKGLWKNSREDEFVIFSLSVFFIAFYAGVTLQGLLVNVRYSIIIYPIMAIIAGLGLSTPLRWEKLNGKRMHLIKLPLFAILIGASAWSLWLIRPFYFNYATDFLPKQYNVNGGWGVGGYEAAQYINSQSATPQSAWTDYEGFCPFLNGRCFKAGQIKWNKKKTINEIDYYVVSRRGMMLGEKRWQSFSDKRSEEPVWELNIDGRPDNFIRVYKNVQKNSQ